MKLAQVARTVKDVARSEEWYTSVLGLQHLYTYGPLAFFDLDGPRLMLSAESGARDGESILYFAVPDIEASYRELVSRGVVFRDAPRLIHRHEDGVEEWMAFFEDLEGRVLALAAKVVPAVGTAGASAGMIAARSDVTAERTDAVAERMGVSTSTSTVVIDKAVPGSRSATGAMVSAKVSSIVA